MIILITGASGKLGATLVKMLSQKFMVFGTRNSDYEFIGFQYMKSDLSNENFDELINWSNLDIIIHSAALTNGNYCKENPLEGFNINGISVKKLTYATSDNVKIIYVSTEAVLRSKWHVAEEIHPVFSKSVYGKSKERGESFLTI